MFRLNLPTTIIFVFSLLAIAEVLPVKTLIAFLPVANASSGNENEIDKLIRSSRELSEKGDSTALEFARKAASIAENSTDDLTRGKAFKNAGEIHSDWDLYEEALNWFMRARPFVNKSGDSRTRAELEKGIGIAYKNNAQYEEAETALKESIRLYKATKDTAGEISSIYELADNARYKGEYDIALELWYQSLRYYETASDSSGIIESKEGIGIVYYMRRNNEKAREIFEENLAYYERRNDTIHLGFSYTLMALIYYRLQEFDRSIEFSKKSVAIRKELQDIRGEGESLNNLALAYMGKKEWSRALDYLVMARRALITGNDFRQIPTILNNMADNFRELGKQDSALRYYNLAISEAEESGQKHTLAHTYRDLSDLFESQGNSSGALKYYQMYADLKDSIFSEEKGGMMEALEMRYESGKKDQQISMLEKENELHKREIEIQEQVNEMEENRGLMLIAGLILLAVVSGVVIWMQSSRMRISKLSHARERQLLEAREELTASDLRNARAQLEINQNKLDFYTQNLIQKNELIEELRSKLVDGNPDNPADQQRIGKIQDLQEMKILTDQDWAEYKSLFDQVYLGFSIRLKEEFPDLTLAEQRLFMLLKLNLNGREIANILGVSPETVKKSRYRLRKRLRLEEDDKLEEYVTAFG